MLRIQQRLQIITLALIFLAGRMLADRTVPGRKLLLSGLEIPFAVFLGFCLLQTVPLPRDWLTTVSPGAARLYERPPAPSGPVGDRQRKQNLTRKA